MDGKTDGQTEFSSLDGVCIPCSAVMNVLIQLYKVNNYNFYCGSHSNGKKFLVRENKLKSI